MARNRKIALNPRGDYLGASKNRYDSQFYDAAKKFATVKDDAYEVRKLAQAVKSLAMKESMSPKAIGSSGEYGVLQQMCSKVEGKANEWRSPSGGKCVNIKAEAIDYHRKKNSVGILNTIAKTANPGKKWTKEQLVKSLERKLKAYKKPPQYVRELYESAIKKVSGLKEINDEARQKTHNEFNTDVNKMIAGRDKAEKDIHAKVINAKDSRLSTRNNIIGGTKLLKGHLRKTGYSWDVRNVVAPALLKLKQDLETGLNIKNSIDTFKKEVSGRLDKIKQSYQRTFKEGGKTVKKFKSPELKQQFQEIEKRVKEYTDNISQKQNNNRTDISNEVNEEIKRTNNNARIHMEKAHTRYKTGSFFNNNKTKNNWVRQDGTTVVDIFREKPYTNKSWKRDRIAVVGKDGTATHKNCRIVKFNEYQKYNAALKFKAYRVFGDPKKPPNTVGSMDKPHIVAEMTNMDTGDKRYFVTSKYPNSRDNRSVRNKLGEIHYNKESLDKSLFKGNESKQFTVGKHFIMGDGSKSKNRSGSWEKPHQIQEYTEKSSNSKVYLIESKHSKRKGELHKSLDGVKTRVFGKRWQRNDKIKQAEGNTPEEAKKDFVKEITKPAPSKESQDAKKTGDATQDIKADQPAALEKPDLKSETIGSMDQNHAGDTAIDESDQTDLEEKYETAGVTTYASSDTEFNLNGENDNLQFDDQDLQDLQDAISLVNQTDYQEQNEQEKVEQQDYAQYGQGTGEQQGVSQNGQSADTQQEYSQGETSGGM